MEHKKSKSFNKSEDQTVDERHYKVFLQEQQKPVPSWHYFLNFHSLVWQLQFTVYILQSIGITHSELEYVLRTASQEGEKKMQK